jgi:hypothetical protein
MRISIKKYNRPYLERLASQMESDPTEAVNYLLTELHRINYSFNSSVNLNLQSFQAPKSLEIAEEIAVSMPGQSELDYVADADIRRLIAIGLDEF